VSEGPDLRTERVDDHLDEMTCLLYIERQLDRKRGQEVAAHAQSCERCQTLLHALERESRLLTRAMLEEDEPIPSRLAAFQERARKSMEWIWGLGFALAATGVYALYTEYIEPMQSRFEQAGFGGSNLLGILLFQGAFWKGWQSMVTLLEVVALLTIAGFGAMFVRRRIRRGSAFAMMIAGLCVTALMASGAMGTEMRKGDSVEIDKDESIKGDIFITGHNVKVEGTVDGDIYLFCQNADIEGHITGDVIAFAQIVRISGQIDGNVRSFTNTTLVSGNVGKSVTAFAETIRVDPAGKVGGSITTFVNGLTLDGHLGRDLLVFSKTARISGKVEGGIQAKGDTLEFGSGAEVAGPVKFTGNKTPVVSSKAKLASPVEFTLLKHHKPYQEPKFYIWKLIWTAAVILFGLVLFLLMPGFARDTVASGERYGAAFGLGLLVLFGIPIAAAIACVTIVGLMVGISTFVLWLVTLFCAQIVVGTVVGQWIMGPTGETWQLIGRMIVGLLIVRAAGMIPFLGGWVRLAVVLWGMGAISLAIYRRFSSGPGEPYGSPAAPYNTPPPNIGPSSLPPNTTIGSPRPA
jgi:cytoskeletal protein CcmA (bactofilin family)